MVTTHLDHCPLSQRFRGQNTAQCFLLKPETITCQCTAVWMTMTKMTQRLMDVGRKHQLFCKIPSQQNLEGISTSNCLSLLTGCFPNKLVYSQWATFQTDLFENAFNYCHVDNRQSLHPSTSKLNSMFTHLSLLTSSPDNFPSVQG
jgi:hypothetical protein